MKAIRQIEAVVILMGVSLLLSARAAGSGGYETFQKTPTFSGICAMTDSRFEEWQNEHCRFEDRSGNLWVHSGLVPGGTVYDYDFEAVSVTRDPGYQLQFSYTEVSSDSVIPAFPGAQSFIGRSAAASPYGEAAPLFGFPGLFRLSNIVSYGWQSGENLSPKEYATGFLSGEDPETNPFINYISSFRHSPAAVKTYYKSSDSNTSTDSSLDLIRVDHVPFMKHDATFEARFEFDSPLSFNFGYRWQRWERDPSYWENVRTDQHTPDIGVNLSINKWLDIGVAYSQSIRNGSDYHLIEANPNQPEEVLLPKFSLADQNRSKVDFTANLTPAENLNISLDCGFSNDTYGNSVYNLVDGTSWQSRATIKWKPFDRLAFSMDYLHEEFTTNQAGAGPGTIRTKDSLDTVGAAFVLSLVPGKLDFVSGGSYSYAQSVCKIASMPDGGQLARFETFMRYKCSEPLSFRIGYLFENIGTGQSGMLLRDPLGDGFRNASNLDTHIVLAVVSYAF